MTGLLPPEHMTLAELLWRLGDALRRRKLQGWDADFAASILGQSKRRGWAPTPKQKRAMCRIIRELRAPVAALIDHEEGG